MEMEALQNGCVGGSALSSGIRRRRGRRGAEATSALKKPPCVFNLCSLAPSTLCSQMLQKIIPMCFFPWFSGNDLTTARKRNVKHSLELFMTSARRRGPRSSTSLDIPERTQHKFPTAGVNCCFSAAPKQSPKKTRDGC